MFRTPAVELIQPNTKESDEARSQPSNGRAGSSRLADLFQEANIWTQLIPVADPTQP